MLQICMLISSKSTLILAVIKLTTEFSRKKILFFSKPTVDECPLCLVYKSHMTEFSDSIDADAENCETCKYNEQHKAKYNACLFHSRYAEVLVLPMLITKEHLFVSCLVCFNETFALKTEGMPDYLIMWHKAITGREAKDVTSPYIRIYVNAARITKFLFGRTTVLVKIRIGYFTALVQYMNTWELASVILKYLEKGCTYMAANADPTRRNW